jgi:hypothetical protein
MHDHPTPPLLRKSRRCARMCQFTINDTLRAIITELSLEEFASSEIHDLVQANRDAKSISFSDIHKLSAFLLKKPIPGKPKYVHELLHGTRLFLVLLFLHTDIYTYICFY